MIECRCRRRSDPLRAVVELRSQREGSAGFGQTADLGRRPDGSVGRSADAANGGVRDSCAVGSYRLLLVEDDDDSAELFTSHAERLGMGVTRARSGEDAVGMAGQADYDLAVVDLLLPGISGWDVVRLLADEPRRRFPVVVSSVLDRHDYPENVQGVLPKPYTRREVEMLLQHLLPDTPHR